MVKKEDRIIPMSTQIQSECLSGVSLRYTIAPRGKVESGACRVQQTSTVEYCCGQQLAMTNREYAAITSPGQHKNLIVFSPMTNNCVTGICAEEETLSCPTESTNHWCIFLFRKIPGFHYWKGSSFSIGGRFERFEKMLESSSILVKSSTMSVQIVKVTDFFQKYIYIYIFSVEKSEHFY